jgi:RNase P subunit RPR2
MEALPPETREFLDSRHQLEFLEAGLQDPLVLSLLREKAREDLGWCSVHRRGNPYDDFVQTCKLCGDTDWFESKGLGSPGPSAQCNRCGLSRDPGRAKPWFNGVEQNGDNVVVRCLDCGNITEYLFKDGPPLTCPRCGRLRYV